MPKDISFKDGQNRFRYKACAIIIEENAVAFMTNPDEDYYYPLGGAVQLGETSEQAVQREILEETGQDYEIDRLVCIHENFFHQDTGRLAGLDCHEISFYYLMTSKGKQFPSLSTQETVHWIPLSELDEHVAYPDFLPSLLPKLEEGIQHIVTKTNSL